MNDSYCTQNLYEGAFLLARGCQLAGKERNKSKYNLIFNDLKGSECLALEFYNGGTIEAKKYSDCYRTLKDYLFTK